MSRLDEIKRRLDELEDERARLIHKQRQVERQGNYKRYLIDLVEADIVKPANANVASAFKEEVLRWLGPERPNKPASTIKGWVLSAICEAPGQLTPADLRDRFKSEFGPRRVPSLRQYLTRDYVQKTKGKLVLTKKGRDDLRKLTNAKRG